MMYHENISTFRGVCGWDDSYIFVANRSRGIDVISPKLKRTVKELHNPLMKTIMLGCLQDPVLENRSMFGQESSLLKPFFKQNEVFCGFVLSFSNVISLELSCVLNLK